MLFKSNSSLIAFDYSKYFGINYIGEGAGDFRYLNFIQSISFDSAPKRFSQKSIGKSLTDKIMYNDPDLNLNISYVQRIDFLNENLFGLYVRESRDDLKSIVYNLYNNLLSKRAFILFKDLQEANQSDILIDIIQSGYSTDLVGIYLQDLYLNSYSFSYVYGSLPIANASFSAEKIKIAKLEKLITDDYAYILSDDSRYALYQDSAQDLFNETNKNLGTNIIYVLNGISLENQISSIEAPISNIDSFLSGNIDNFNLSIDFGRNKFLFFEKGNGTFSREFLLPCVGSLKFSGKTSYFTEKSLQDFINNDGKFSLKIKIGKEDFDSRNDDYTELLFSNITLENFSYEISVNNLLTYSITCSFEINQFNGFIIDSINKKEGEEILTDSRLLLRTSDGQFLRSENSIFVVRK
jgi:hypothetical protein